MKLERQAKILEIISENDVETQEDLSRLLKQSGFNATQATISRDIKELRLLKIMTEDGRHKYAISSLENEDSHIAKLKTIFRESVISYDMAQNIVVLKTLPGLASAACSAIDNLHISKVVGTIAGDDTCIVVMRDFQAAMSFTNEIRDMLV